MEAIGLRMSCAWVAHGLSLRFLMSLSSEALMWRGFAGADWVFFGDSYAVLQKIRLFGSADSRWLHIGTAAESTLAFGGSRKNHF